jgi:hypothetical protein
MPGLLISMESNGGMSAVNGKLAASTADANNTLGKAKTPGSHALTNGDTPIPGLGPYPTPNGVSPSSPGPAAVAPSTILDLPPELRHIDAGVPLGTLIERVGQLCYRGIEDLVDSLAKKPVQMANGIGGHAVNGSGNKADANQIKKKEIMDFVHLHRSKFIKLSVLVKWSEQAAKQMDQMIDLKAWAHDLDVCYEEAANEIGVFKRNLNNFKLRSPDMETALAVLSTGKVPWMADVRLDMVKLTYAITNRTTARLSSFTTAQSKADAKSATKLGYYAQHTACHSRGSYPPITRLSDRQWACDLQLSLRIRT